MLVLTYRIESGEMKIVKDKGEEEVLFYGGVVITDTNATIMSPIARYAEKEGLFFLEGPVSGTYGERSFQCGFAKIEERNRIFRGYSSCKIEGRGEYLKCDSMVLQSDSLKAFGKVYLLSNKDSLEAGGGEVLLKENFIRARKDAFLRVLSSDSLTLNSQFYVYKDSLLTASGNVRISSRNFEAEGDSLSFDQRLKIAKIYGRAKAKDSKNDVMGDTVFVFLNSQNKVDSAKAVGKASLKSLEDKRELFLEGDSLTFYSFGSDTLKNFRGFNVKGYIKEVEEVGNSSNGKLN